MSTFACAYATIEQGTVRRDCGAAGALGRLAAACAFGVCVLLAGMGPATASVVRGFAYHSDALGRDQVAQVYVPDGTAPETGWPVLYLLHGLNGAPTDWDTIGGLRATLDKMIVQHVIKPMMVVMPQGANSWYVDSAEVGGPGNYASAIAHDLPNAVEAAFPVGRDRAHRAIGGLSMGGFGALRIALCEPDRYIAVAAMSPAIWQNVPAEVIAKRAGDASLISATSYFRTEDPMTVTVGIDLPPEGKHFGGAFGTPFDPKRFNEQNVFTLLEKSVEGKKLMPHVYVTVGDDDSHLLWRGAFAFFETMQMHHRQIEFRVTDGDHDWHCWKRSTSDAIAFIDRYFSGDVAE